MASTINASNTGFGGIVQTGDSSGQLQLQTAGTTAVTLDTSQNATFAGKVTSAGALTLASNGSTTAVTIDTSQNVGIGTTSPGTKLDVNGGIQISGGSDLGFGAQIYNSNSPNYALSSVSYQISFLTGNNNARLERMRIDSSGNLFLGTTSSLIAGVFQLSSTSDGMTSKTSGAFNNIPYFAWNSSTTGDNIFMRFYTEATATLRGNIDYNRAGNAVRYNTTSDQRLKENIVDAPSATSLIDSIKIRSFDWKETGFHVDYGVIAQELYQVAPDAVSKGSDDDNVENTWGVDTSVLVPAMIKAIQEQQAIIEDLKQRIETLEAK